MLADKPWKGKILFDTPRHKTIMNLPLDWPRINQFPEWSTVQDEKSYRLAFLAPKLAAPTPRFRNRTCFTYKGDHLRKGIKMNLKPDVEHHLLISPALPVKAITNDSFLQIEIDNNKVLRYNHAPVRPPEDADPLYTRSGFIHPLWSPKGAVLTDSHPPDHIHHVGIWMPWTKTRFEGREIDFWNLEAGKGTVRFAKFLSTTSGPVYGGFAAHQQHTDLTAPAGEKVVLNETWDVRAYSVGGPQKGCWLWDFISTQRCATDSPVHHSKYRYGGLGFRATRQWKAENSECLTSEGKTREDGHGTRARWCDTYGRTGPDWTGVTVMSHPENFRHPEPMRIWPKKNTHAFFNFAPSQLGDWTMQPGKEYFFRYRFYVHQGKPVPAEIDRLWNDFAHPPKVKLEKLVE
jgi:hypothetical protein